MSTHSSEEETDPARINRVPKDCNGGQMQTREFSVMMQAWLPGLVQLKN